MMATVPHVTSRSGLREFQTDGFLFDRVYHCWYVEGRLVTRDFGNYIVFRNSN